MQELITKNNPEVLEIAPVTWLQGIAAPDTLDDWGKDIDLERLYLSQIERYPLLSAAEEVSTAKRIEAGLYAGHKLLHAELGEDSLSKTYRADLQVIAHDGQIAKETFINSNLRLVVSLARRLRFRLPLMDAIGCGNIGLIRAVEKFDYAQGNKFSGYAAWWIRQAIQEGRRSSYGFELSKGERTKLDTLRSAESELIAMGEVPTIRRLKEKTSLSSEEIHDLNGMTGQQISLDAPVRPDSQLAYAEVLAGETPEHDNFRATDGISDAASEALKVMHNTAIYDNELHYTVITLRWGLRDGKMRSIAEVAEMLDIPATTLRREERNASKSIVRALVALGYAISPDRTFLLDLRK